ncbi:hypothetical protein Aab01nite_01470 [Paractinoplanes abujensis]|uniref:Uncharacterized protein n=1 Tax=Paractinoplanes abujensis TaxID=882441 RepID=A0A7W7CNZ1_9ACTN|nr:hypothetical protein [Actinoplanes abujensis]MBB4692027.1 hypothetical protein [Actinoplanes abujensis]GID16557.1 hypothetical protein Aab01nite_01470 [Actinoplanes abujensis]
MRADNRRVLEELTARFTLAHRGRLRTPAWAVVGFCVMMLELLDIRPRLDRPGRPVSKRRSTWACGCAARTT